MADDKRAKRDAGQQTAADEQTIKAIMASYEGRRWMCSVLERSNMYSPMYRFDGDTVGMAWRDGAADMGRFLLGQIDQYAPNDYQRLIREMRARNERAAEAEQQRLKADEAEPEIVAIAEDWADRQMAEYEAARRDGARQEEEQ